METMASGFCVGYESRIDTLTKKFDRELADSVLEGSIRANRKIVEELRGDENMCQVILEIMEPEINEIREREVCFK